MELKVKRMDNSAHMPNRAHAGDAGFDIYSAMSYDIQPGERVQISTRIALEIPEGHVGLIWDKSGLSHLGGLKVLGGVVDSGYRGEIMVGIINLGREPFTIKGGDKIAQILIQKYEAPKIVEVSELSIANRGEGGFGSTGR